MSRRNRRSNATGAGNGRRAPLGVRPPSFVDAGPEQHDQALVALRFLYRDHLESLDSGVETSVDPSDQEASRRST